MGDLLMAFIASLLTGRFGPWLIGGAILAAAAGWIWLQGQRIEGLQDDLEAAQDRAATAESANALLAAEMDRQAAERARNEAALAAERDAAEARARSTGRALETIRNAPDADRPFSPGVADALRRLHVTGPSRADPTD